MKICTKCQIPQPLENFSNNKNTKDGKRSQCKLCDKQHWEENKEIVALNRKQYREENKEKIRESLKQWRDSNKEVLILKRKTYYEENKNRIILRQKEYNKQNTDVVLLKKQKYREENKEKVSEIKKQWYENNKEHTIDRIKQYRQTSTGRAVYKNTFHKRRIIEKQGDVTTAQLKELLDNSTHCFYCKNPLILNEIHIDHYIPLSKGGLHTISNLRIACKKCNLEKGKKMPQEFIKKD